MNSQTTYIFDGHNVIHSLPFFRDEAKKISPEKCRELLLKTVLNFKHKKKIRRIVVFDGSEEVPDLGRCDFKGIQVHYSKKPFKDADSLIVSLAGKQKQDTFVVTNDREVIKNVKFLGCKGISPNSLFGSTGNLGKENRIERLKSGKEGITKSEKEEFLKLFSKEDDS